MISDYLRDEKTRNIKKIRGVLVKYTTATTGIDCRYIRR